MTASAITEASILPASSGEPADLAGIEGVSEVRAPWTAQGVALAVIATVAAVFALEWAQSFFISLLLGILFAYTLNPLVNALEAWHLPRVIASSIVMLGVIFALVGGAYSLRGQMQTILEQVPAAASKLSAELASMRRGRDSTMAKVQTAATEIEKVTTGMSGAPRSGVRVLEAPTFRVGNYLLVGSMSIAGMLGQASMVLFLTYFLMLSGDTYKRKLVRLTGPSLSLRKITVRMLDDINASIQRYMFMLLATNVMLGVLTWLGLRWIGLDNAGAWGTAAGLLHVIPYFGPVVTAAALGLAAFMQFDSWPTAFMVVGMSLAIATFIGAFVTTWMTGRIAKMNTAAVFTALLFWAWLWGVWGMLLSIPIIVIVKVVSQHIEQLNPVAELLGE